MTNKDKPTSRFDNIESHYQIFKSKLDAYKDDQKDEYLVEKQRLLTDLSERTVVGDPVKADEFYDLFAAFTERSNSFKMLYQVLIDEHYGIGLFDENDVRDLRELAIAKIRRRLVEGVWHGIRNINERADFRNAMIRAVRARVHERAAARRDDGKPFAALCLSGGGIRSATFGLGVIQGLARHNLLDKFDYLSTVSGGGYIGSWLSGWIYRLTPAEAVVCDNEIGPRFTTQGVEEVRKILTKRSAETPEPAEVTHLRSYSNYMSPRTGLFSTDTWTLIAVYLRNLLLNWTVFVPLIAAILLLPKILQTAVAIDYPDFFDRFLLIIATISGLWGIVNINAMRPSLSRFSWVDQRYTENDIGITDSVEAKVLQHALFRIFAFALFLAVFWAVSGDRYHLSLSVGLAKLFRTDKIFLFDVMFFAVFLFVGGYILAWLFMLPNVLRPKTDKGASVKTTFSWKKLWRKWGSYVSEFLISIVCGAVGGLLLFLVVDNLDQISVKFHSILGQTIETKNAGFATAFVVCAGVPLVLLVFLLASTLFVGLAARFTNDEDREWMARLGALVLMVILVWMVISTAVIFGPKIFDSTWPARVLTSLGGISGLVTLVLGFSSKSTGKEEGEAKPGKSLLMWFLPAVAAPVFVLFLVITLSFLTELLIEKASFFSSYRHTVWFVILLCVGLVMGLFININKFSIHSIYRERLIRAYLGASRTKARLRTANSFTGLDSERDNIEMWRLRQKPFHIINMTLNLAKTQNLRWQNRKAESFTASALYCGSSNMGEGSGNYRKTADYGVNAQNGTAISIGTAAAISGAAASPNMGYFTMSAAVSFLMVLFNVRLGWWLGNPGRRGNETFRLAAPRWSPRLFIDESIGGTDDSKPYVYLSDGGHFENLGLYEMVLRRCALIVVVDAACDLDFGFSDLGKAIHKIRVDMGIPIEFDSERSPVKGRNCTIGKIRYTCADPGAKDGTIIYVKPTLDGDEPIDLKNYARENVDFPHESTADQMYSESQFESYRSLGLHQISTICCQEKTGCVCAGLDDLVGHAEHYAEAWKLKMSNVSVVSGRGIRADRRR